MFKRAFDVTLATLFLLFFAPVIVVLAALIVCAIGKPVLFKQLRPGLRAVPFYILKFRSMNNKKNSAGELLPDAQRLTQLGKFLRSTSLDELPSLWNVLKGEMSLVGPRPLLMEYVPLYNSFQNRRHEVKPGITGWAQVNGRNAIGWDENFKLDVWYVENQSIWLDVKILWMTVLKVLKRQDIVADAHVTMPKFMGNNE